MQVGQREFETAIANWKKIGSPSLPIDRFHWGSSNETRVTDPKAKAAVGWIDDMRVNAAGNLVVTPAGGAAVTLTGVDPAQYHEHEMTYSPVTLAVEYRVDGVVKIAGDMLGGVGVSSGTVQSNTTIDAVTVGGSLIGGTGDGSGLLTSNGAIGHVRIGGDLIGGSATGSTRSA